MTRSRRRPTWRPASGDRQGVRTQRATTWCADEASDHRHSRTVSGGVGSDRLWTQLRGIQPVGRCPGLTSDTWGAKDDVHADARAVRPVMAGNPGVRASRDRRWRRRGGVDRIVDAPTNSLALHRHRPAAGKATTSTDDQLRARVRPYRHHPVAGRCAAHWTPTSTLWRAGLVTSGDGVISLSWPVGTQWDATVSVGVILDLGRLRSRGEGGTHVPTPRGQPVDGGAGDALGRLGRPASRHQLFTDGFTPVALNATATTAQTG